MKPFFFLILATAFICNGCKKYLDAKPGKNLTVPSTLADYQALLDNNAKMNRVSPTAGEGSADNYYLTDGDWASIEYQGYRNVYIWGDEIIYDLFPNDWGQEYDKVYFSNVCLDGLSKIQKNANNSLAFDNVEGSSLFFRANSFLKLVLTWAKAFDSSTASTDLGIPLRLTPDFNQTSLRASVKASYEQIISDLQQAVPLLPNQASYAMRPNKPAAYALLSRCYLAMRDYSNAGRYADSALQLNNKLLDYNTIDGSADYPLPAFNEEVLFTNFAYGYELDDYIAKVDSSLYKSYDNNDLRKTLFFRDNSDGTYAFRGNYTGDYVMFTGIAADELYLTRAECYARANQNTQALADLNTLLQNRYRIATFIPYTNVADVLSLVLTERRKELPFRDLRWMDLKRLNFEPKYAKTLSRLLNGQPYTLAPNNPRYALPLPQSVIQLTGMPQNP